MLRSYLRIAYRNINRHKGYTTINVVGLSIGLTVFVLIALFVRHELSYDRFHSKSERIYRIHRGDYLSTSVAMAPAMEENIPEVERAIRIDAHLSSEVLVEHSDDSHYEKGFYFVDSTFFDVFDFALLRGNPKTALAAPFSVVLTREMAEKYFPDEDALGKSLKITGWNDPGVYEVTGVLADVPSNSHFQFSFLASWQTQYAYKRAETLEQWFYGGFHTYVLLSSSAQIQELPGPLARLLKTQDSRFRDRTLSDLESLYGFHPLTEIHLYSHRHNELGTNGDPKYLYIFSAIAFLVLLIAGINYVNLTTAQATKRAREVGVRKVAGADKRQLVYQFLSESALLILASMALSVLLVALSLSRFESLVNRNLSLNLAGLEVWLIVGGVLFSLGLLCGLYPALYLAGFEPAQVLKGLVTRGSSNARFRSGSVVIQFTASVALIASTLVIQQQLSYMHNRPLGMNPEQVVVLKSRDAFSRETIASFKNELLKNSRILAVAETDALPPMPPEHLSQLRRTNDATDETEDLIHRFGAGPGYVETLELEVVEGRACRQSDIDEWRDGMSVLLNEAAVRQYGWTEPIGMEFDQFEPVPSVVGVVKDFNYQSLKTKVEPLGILCYWASPFVLIRTDTAELPGTLAYVEEEFATFAPGVPFEFTFLDDEFAAAYDAEERLAETFIIFSGLAILIACLGLFGLASFMAQRRAREIGIRKVLGASVAGVVALLSREFVKLVVAASVIGLPLAYFLMQGWLADFAYKTTIGPEIFLLSGFIVLAIAVLSVSHQAIRAGLTNPVDSIRRD